MAKDFEKGLKGEMKQGNPAPNCFTAGKQCEHLHINQEGGIQVRGCRELTQNINPRTQTIPCPAYTPASS